MNVQDEIIKIHSLFGMSEKANYLIQKLFDSEIKKVKQEYEEKLRWIPVEEKEPEMYNCQMLLRNESVKFVDIRFIPHKKQFDLICQIHNYTHYRFI